jgi:hypothetical protein
MKLSTLTAILILISVMTYIAEASATGHEDFAKDMEEWNAWSKKNQNNKKFKKKKYKPAVQVLSAEESQGGIEAMRFMHMYRNN